MAKSLLRSCFLGLFALVLGVTLLWAQEHPLTTSEGLKLKQVTAEPAVFKGRKALKIVQMPNAQGEASLAILPQLGLQDGTIEVDLVGMPAAGASTGARGFVGVAFRVNPDASKFECFYLRPTNGRAEDQLRRNHSSQYISFPDHPWHRLRQETPGKYESYVDLVPGEWTKVKIVVSGSKALLYVHGSDQPTIIVNDLKHDVSKGDVALWVGPGSDCYFSNLRITK